MESTIPTPASTPSTNRLTVSPGVPVPLKVGVLIAVMLSVLDEPVSEAAARSGVPACAGGWVIMLTLKAGEAALKVPFASSIFEVSECTPSARALEVMATLPAAISAAVRITDPTSTPLSYR